MRPLRLEVLRPLHDFDAVVWPGDDDPRAAHYAVRGPDGRVLAAGSLIPEAPGLRVRGMATAPEARGQGLGTVVLAALLAHAGDEALVWCSARERAVSLYERAGFVAQGGVHDEPGIGPHVRMLRAPARARSPAPPAPPRR